MPIRLFVPFEGMRVWHRSVDRECDIFEVVRISEVVRPRRFESPVPYAYANIRRSGRGAGPTVRVGPGHSPLAGGP